MLKYCDKCGNFMLDCLNTDRTCEICKNLMKVVPERYWDASDPLKGVDYLEYEVEEKVRRELVYTSPNYDKWEEQRRKRVIMEDAKQYMKYESTEDSYTVTCPYCKSTNTKKISILSRAIWANIFGLASPKIGKQWHCNDCRSNF